MTLLREASPIDGYRRAVERVLANNGRLEDAQVREMLQELAAVRWQLMEELRNIPSNGNTWRADQIRMLKGQIEQAASTFATRYGVPLHTAQEDAWVTGSELGPVALDRLGVAVPIFGISTIQLEVSKQLTADLIKAVTQDFVQRASKKITLGVMGEKPPFQIMKTIEELLRTQPERGSYGIIANQAERIVRTEMHRTFSIANRIRTEEVVKAVPELLHYWSAVMDNRTRIEHAHADAAYAPGSHPGPIPVAKPFKVGGENLMYPGDPAGSPENTINCRCVALMYNAKWFR